MAIDEYNERYRTIIILLLSAFRVHISAKALIWTYTIHNIINLHLSDSYNLHPKHLRYTQTFPIQGILSPEESSLSPFIFIILNSVKLAIIIVQM